jgi:hypothetical protein
MGFVILEGRRRMDGKRAVSKACATSCADLMETVGSQLREKTSRIVGQLSLVTGDRA